jgi:tripartite-type tricarboxylate transporter receptor subunit TctC
MCSCTRISTETHWRPFHANRSAPSVSDRHVCGTFAESRRRLPLQAITLIVPYQAGGSIDTAVLAIAQSVSKKLGQPVIVKNKPGASGTLGSDAMAATAKPDGYTISNVGITVFPLPLLQKTTYDPEKDFTYIANLAGITFGVTAGAQTPFKSWADVVAYAKKNPGKLSCGSPGQNTTPHLGMERLTAAAGIELTHTPFKSSPDSNAALVGGDTELLVDGVGCKPIVESGKARLLAVWTSKRTKRWPEVPTLRGLGYPLVSSPRSASPDPRAWTQRWRPSCMTRSAPRWTIKKCSASWRTSNSFRRISRVPNS